MFSIRLAAAAAVLATVVTSVSASSSINETALCRLPESEDLATLLEGAAGVSPVNSIIFTHWKQFSKVFLLSQLEFAPPQSTLFCSPCAVAQFYAAKKCTSVGSLDNLFFHYLSTSWSFWPRPAEAFRWRWPGWTPPTTSPSCGWTIWSRLFDRRTWRWTSSDSMNPANDETDFKVASASWPCRLEISVIYIAKEEARTQFLT